jgi:hypothetical protein
MHQRVTIAGIERTTAIIGILCAAALSIFAAPAIGFACALGSVFMIINFFLLALVGGGILALARGGTAPLAILLIPLKLAFFIGVSYLIIARLHANVPGFVAGVLTQFVAIFIEVWRASPGAPALENSGIREKRI